jgi:hypothetical protein
MSCAAPQSEPPPKQIASSQPAPSVNVKQNAIPKRAPSINVSDVGIKSRIAAGSQLFNRIKAKIPAYDINGQNTNPVIAGVLTNTPVLQLYITNKIWKGLTKREQVNLTYYVEDQIRVARTDPEKYVGFPKSAPGYPSFLQATRNLCDDCWLIMLGDPVLEEGERAMSVDRTAVEGDSIWARGDARSQVSKASQFRGTASRPASANKPANSSTQETSLGAYFDKLEPICSAMQQLFLDRGYEVSVKPGAVGDRVGIVVDCTRDPRPKVACYSLYETFPDKADRRTLVKANVHVIAFRFEGGWLANGEFIKPIQ